MDQSVIFVFFYGELKFKGEHKNDRMLVINRHGKIKNKNGRWMKMKKTKIPTFTGKIRTLAIYIMLL